MGLQTELYILNKSTSVGKTLFTVSIHFFLSYANQPAQEISSCIYSVGKVYNLAEKLLNFNKIIPATSGDSKAQRLSY